MSLKVWVARDNEEIRKKFYGYDPQKILWLYRKKPERIGAPYYQWSPYNKDIRISVPPDHPWGQDLTWEDEPRELELVDAEEIKNLQHENGHYKAIAESRKNTIEELKEEVKKLREKKEWLERRVIDLTDTCKFKDKQLTEYKNELEKYKLMIAKKTK